MARKPNTSSTSKSRAAAKPRAKKAAPLPVTLEEQRDALIKALKPIERKFVERYAVHYKAARAYREAGYRVSQKSSWAQGATLAKRADIREIMRLHQEITIRDYDMGHDEIALRYWRTATAQVADLVQHRRPPCRYCYGKDHEYQWKTAREYREAFDHAMAKLTGGMDPEQMATMQEAIRSGEIIDPSIPKDIGGYGYDLSAAPNPDCPECRGIGGSPITTITDTDLMSQGAALLYDGVKETKEGIEVKLTDRMTALEKLAKHLGMFTSKVDDEVINPLEALAARMMRGAETVPVVPDEDAPTAGFNLTSPQQQDDEAAHDVPPELQQEDDGYVEP